MNPLRDPAQGAEQIVGEAPRAESAREAEPAPVPEVSEADPPAVTTVDPVSSESPRADQLGDAVDPVSVAESQSCRGSLGWGGLVQDLQRYETTNVRVHAGDLYDYSVWAAKAVERWFDQAGTWTEGLEDADRCIAVVAAFLHDIGKAGDNQVEFYTKEAHAETGRRYVLEETPYLLEDGGSFEFDRWFEQLGLDESDQKLVAFLVAVHRALGEEIMAEAKGVSSCEDVDEDLVRGYVDRLESQWGGDPDERLAKLAMLIGAADVLAMQPVQSRSKLFGDDLPDLDPPHSGANKYVDWEYETEGAVVRSCVLQFLRETS